MAFSDKKGINIASPFKLQAEELLDVRQKVDTIAERDELVNIHAAAPGLRVFVTANKTTYIYNGSGWDALISSANIGSQSVTTATKLSSSAGSATQPIYFSSGKPAACSYTLGKSVPSNAVFTDTTYSDMKGATNTGVGTHGLVPAPSAGAANRYLRSDGTWAVPPDTNTTYTLGSFGITASAAEINYTKGVTSSIQTQLNNKAASGHIHPVATTGANGFMPKLNGSTSNYLRGDGTWATPPNADTTYNKFTGASGSAAGTVGLVPAPAAGASNRYLRSDGTWSVPPDTNTWTAMKGASGSVAGTAGYVPAPIAGAANRYLRSDGTWSVPPDTNTTYTLGSFGITASAAEINYTKGVTSSIQAQLNGKASSSHTHNYAGSSSSGGSAYSADVSYHQAFVADNEIRFVKPSWDSKGKVFIGHRWSDGSLSDLIEQYDFCNGAEGLTKVAASTFIGSLSGNADTATSASAANVASTLGRNGDNSMPMTFHWDGKDGQPSWIWGGEDGTNMYIYKPSSFRVKYASAAGGIIDSNNSDRTIKLSFSGTGLNTSTLAYFVGYDSSGNLNWTSVDTVKSKLGLSNYASASHSHHIATTSAAGFLPKLNGSTSNYLRGDGSWATPPDTNTTYTLGSFGITASAAEINYTKGVTSSIQTQLNGKAASSHSHSTASTSSAGFMPKLNGSTSNYLRGDGSWATPPNTNTDTKVTNVAANTSTAYITGTTSSSTNTGTQIFDTGVYLTSTSGRMHAESLEIGGAILTYDATNKSLTISFS